MEPAASRRRVAEDARGQAAVAAPSSDAKGRLPLTELARDVTIAALESLSAVDLAAAGAASRVMFLLAGEVQQRPTLVVEAGTPKTVLDALGQRLAATPTLGFLFGTRKMVAQEPNYGNGSSSSEDEAEVGRKASLREQVGDILSRRLPPHCSVIGAASHELQALVPSGPRAPGAAPARSYPDLSVQKDSDRMGLMLGSFPQAVAQSFALSRQQCHMVERAPNATDAAQRLQGMGVPLGPDWKTVVVIASQDSDPDPVIQGIQSSNPDAAILGGIAGMELLRHTRGQTRVQEGGIVGLALKGDVPLTALVSRGCVPLAPPMRSRNAEAHHKSYAVVPALIEEQGASQVPLQVVMEAGRRDNCRAPIFSGLRSAEAGGGFLLEGLSQGSFDKDGSLTVALPPSISSRLETNDPVPVDLEVGFFKLDAEACKQDVARLLGHVRQQCEASNDRTLGAVMFTCGGRGTNFFGEEFVDAKAFANVFPSTPLLGYWAGGEIGPMALAEAAPEEATRTGRASLQGFTAVYGIFRAPAPSCRSALLNLPDDALAASVGEVLAERSRSAKDRGNAAFRESDWQDAITHYRRADSLSMVDVAQVPASEQAIIKSNLSIAHMKANKHADALIYATAAIALDASNTKAHHRRITALVQLGKEEEASAALEEAREKCPGESFKASLADYKV